MSLAVIGAGVGIAATGYSVYNSAHKNAEAKKLAANNVRPVFNPDGSIKDVYNMQAANLSDTTLQDYGQRQIQQGQSEAIDAVLKSGGRLDFGTVNNQYGNQMQSLLANIARTRDTRLAGFNNAAYNLAGSNDASFQYNQDAPFKDKKQEEALLRQQAEQAKMDSFSYLSNAIGAYGTATNTPGAYANRTARQENRQINRELDRRNDITGAPDRSGPALLENNTPSPQVTGQINPNPPRAVNTNFDYSDTRTILYLDQDGNPVYG